MKETSGSSHFNFTHKGCDLCRAIRTNRLEEMLLSGFGISQPPAAAQTGFIWLAPLMPSQEGDMI